MEYTPTGLTVSRGVASSPHCDHCVCSRSTMCQEPLFSFSVNCATYEIEELLAAPSYTYDLSLPMPMVEICLFSIKRIFLALFWPVLIMQQGTCLMFYIQKISLCHYRYEDCINGPQEPFTPRSLCSQPKMHERIELLPSLWTIRKLSQKSPPVFDVNIYNSVRSASDER